MAHDRGRAIITTGIAGFKVFDGHVAEYFALSAIPKKPLS
jgi:hypothetical protein